MTTEFTAKQPSEAYAISFDFTTILDGEIISTVNIIAIDQLTFLDVSTVVLDFTKQSNTNSVVSAWVRAGTSGHSYLITCYIVGDSGSNYELDAILPVVEAPGSAVSSGTRLVTPPAIEPVLLSELKYHLNLSSGTLLDNTALSTSIAAGSHAINSGYALLGIAIDVLGCTAIVNLEPVNNGTGGTVDIKIQESDAVAGPFVDWTGGAFTQITEANDTAIQRKMYTGGKQYIRPVGSVLVAASEFGVSIQTYLPISSDDVILLEAIETARIEVENDTSRAIITQTWNYCPKHWPNENRIKIPLGNLQSVSFVKWKDVTGTEHLLTEGKDYIVETNGIWCGFIVLPYQGIWPYEVLYPSNPITIQFVCGYGDTAASVPSTIKKAIKQKCANYYQNRGDDVVGTGVTVTLDKTYQRLLDKIPPLYDIDFI